VACCSAARARTPGGGRRGRGTRRPGAARRHALVDGARGPAGRQGCRRRRVRGPLAGVPTGYPTHGTRCRYATGPRAGVQSGRSPPVYRLGAPGRVIGAGRGPGRALGVGADVDPPAGELGREPGVLALAADGQGELVVGHDDASRAQLAVDDLDRGDPRGRQRRGDERGRVVGPVDDVDLLAVQLAHDGTHPRAHRADARALGVQARNGGVHRDLGAVTGLAGQRLDLDAAVGDLGHLEREELLDQVGVGARQADLRAAHAALDRDDEAAQPLAVHVLLTGNLLGQRQDALDRAEVDGHVSRVGALLDDAGDDVALAALEVAEDRVVLDVPQPLHDHLSCRGGRNPAEAGRGVVELGTRLAVWSRGVALVIDLALGGWDLVVLPRPDDDVPGLAVELGARVAEVTVG